MSNRLIENHDVDEDAEDTAIAIIDLLRRLCDDSVRILLTF